MKQKTPKDIETAKTILKNGQTADFWKLICEAIDDSIADIQSKQDSDDFRDLPSLQYKLETEIMKAKRKYLSHLKNLPQTLIEHWTEPAGNIETSVNFDPYFTVKELKKEETTTKV